jgi:hypothetical protein
MISRSFFSCGHSSSARFLRRTGKRAVAFALAVGCSPYLIFAQNEGSGLVPPSAKEISATQLTMASSLEKSQLEQLSNKISTSTGLAISPLVVAGGLGGYQWWITPPEHRAKLALFYHPWVWGAFLGLGFLFLMNSCIGTLIPFLKKPMDLVETFEHTATGLLIGLPIFIFMQIPSSLVMPSVATHLPDATAGFIVPFFSASSWVFSAFTWIFWLPVLLICFFSVWALSQFINLLILLSPWGGFDLLLRMIRGTALVVIFLAALISPWLALLVCSLIILFSLLFIRFTLRACRFAAYLTLDLFLGIFCPHRSVGRKLSAYTLVALGQARKRTLGRVEPSADGCAQFCYGRKEVIQLGRGLELRDGLLGGVISESGTDSGRKLVRISKRYRLLQPQVAENLGLVIPSGPVKIITAPKQAALGIVRKCDTRVSQAFERWKNNLIQICAEIKS